MKNCVHMVELAGRLGRRGSNHSSETEQEMQPNRCSSPILVGAVASLLLSCAPGWSQAEADAWTRVDPGWSRYSNGRFGTVADVPLELFPIRRAPPQNGDGRTLEAPDGSAELRVYGSRAPQALGSFGAYRQIVARSEPAMSYRAGGSGWFVLSGQKGGEIRYTKVVERCGAAHSVFLRYPAAQKRRYDPIVARISSSLSARCSAT